jgi:transposase
MAAVATIGSDFSASQLRRLAARLKHASQARHLLSLAAVLGGASREEAARIAGMDRQTLRDWVHRFSAEGPGRLRISPRRAIRPR